jgi:hypothetical protein
MSRLTEPSASVFFNIHDGAFVATRLLCLPRGRKVLRLERQVRRSRCAAVKSIIGGAFLAGAGRASLASAAPIDPGPQIRHLTRIPSRSQANPGASASSASMPLRRAVRSARPSANSGSVKPSASGKLSQPASLI